MSEQVNKEQTKDAKQEEIPELTDDQLDEVAGGVLSLSKASRTKRMSSLDGKGNDVLTEES